MDNKNVRRTPFGAQIATQQEVNRATGVNPSVTSGSDSTRPVRNMPKKKDEIRQDGGISDVTSQHMGGSVGNVFSAPQQNIQEDLSSKEYDSLKIYNTSKNFLRTTTEKLPATSSLLKDCSFPIGLIINPCAYFEGDLPTVNYGEMEIPRCYSSACRAYINPFVKWIEGGDKWICNLCKHINNTESYYYGRLDKYNQRVDVNDKPDLSAGSYEFIANKTYMKKDKPLNQPVYIFVIDVSMMSSQNGYLSAVLESIKDAINSDTIPYQEKTKVKIKEKYYFINLFIFLIFLKCAYFKYFHFQLLITRIFILP